MAYLVLHIWNEQIGKVFIQTDNFGILRVLTS
jgi:hypothetical protein